MNLLPKHMGHSASEYDMQDEVAELMFKLSFSITRSERPWFIDIHPKVYREVTISEIGRRSDIIVQVTPRKIFNIECKISDCRGVLKQAIDHLKWADYSYICIHDKAYIPDDVIREMLDKGIGLLMWEKGMLMESFGSRHNKGKDKLIRESVMRTLKKKDSEIEAKKHIQTEIAL